MNAEARIPIADPAAEYRELAAGIDAAVRRVLASGRYILGPEGAALEAELAALVGAAHAVGVNSGTDALHFALRAAGVGPGDEVVMPAFTFVATAEAASYTGARPVFADIDEATFCLDPRSLEASLTPRTRAVIAVHLYGHCAAMAQIAEICRSRSLVLVEDCAQSLGADYDGRRAGAWGDFGCFSFYPTKNLAAAGDAGMITARDARHAERLRMLRHHGSSRSYLHDILGYNSRLDELQAAILRVKLGSLERFNAGRAAIARHYLEHLSDLGLRLPADNPRGRHVWHQFTVRSEKREALRAALELVGIASMIYYPVPLHRQPLYAADCAGLSLPVTEAAARTVLSLPIFPQLAEDQLRRVCKTIRACA
ncbi:MAG: DegT/DnrJ/EryC1/StrS family aminotransferase [Betaproteobacteria bacterium]|nr:DegT/DnrJ/EryC1/StrS family aminotransferase [Betaproteobacteria bacterium]